MKNFTQFQTPHLPKCIKICLLVFSLFLSGNALFAQKVAVIGIDHTSNVSSSGALTYTVADGFSFVATQDIAANSVIYFTNAYYSNANTRFRLSSNSSDDANKFLAKYTSPASVIAKGTVVRFQETGTTTNTLAITCSSGSCGTVSLIALGANPVNFSIPNSLPMSIYAFEKANDDPYSGTVTTVHSVLYNGYAENLNATVVIGGNIPAAMNPTTNFSTALVLDGFPTTSPNSNFYTTIDFKTSLRGGAVSKISLEDPSNYNVFPPEIPESFLSTTAFTNLNLVNVNPTVSVAVSPSSVLENGVGSLVYTFTLSVVAASNITVNYTTTGSTATSGSDYTALSGSVVISSGTNSATVTVNPTDDATLEPNETLILTVSTGTGYDVGSPSVATGTITNDDTDTAQPKVAISGLNHGAIPADVESFSFAALEDIAAGTKIYFTDNAYDKLLLKFTNESKTVFEWTAPATVNRGDVYVISENTDGGTTFTLTCSDGSGCGSVAVTQGSGMTFAPSGATLVAFSDSNTDPFTGTTPIVGQIHSVFYSGTLSISGGALLAANNPTSVYPNAVVTDNFPAVAPVRTEYKFASGERAVSINRTLFTNTTNWVHAGNTQTVSTIRFNNITITNGVTLPLLTVNVSPNSVAENSGTGMVYTFTLSANATSNITVNFTVTGTAVFSTDYTQTGAASFATSTGTIVIPSGGNSASVTITPVGETTLEPNETVVLTVNTGTGYDAGSPSVATGTITNDDVKYVNPLVVIVGMNHGNNSNPPASLGPDGFSFAANQNLTAGTEIYFSDSPFNNTSLTIGTLVSLESVTRYTVPSGGLAKGQVVYIVETGASTNAFTVTCSAGSNCGTATYITQSVATDFNFASPDGDNLYAYTDTDGNPTNGITDVHALFYTINGSIPSIENPTTVFPNAIVISGFGSASPDRTEYKFASSERSAAINLTNIKTISNYLIGQTTQALSVVPFAALNLCPASITANPSNASRCPGGNATFTVTATGGTSFQWQVNTGSGFTDISNGGIYSGATSATLTLTNVPFANNGFTYQCVVNACATSTAATLTVFALPTATASSNSPVCVGGTINLTGGAAGNTYAWSGPSFASTGQSPSIANATTAATGIYTISVTNANSCTSTATTSVTVNALPTINVSASPAICAGAIAFSIPYSGTTGSPTTYSISGTGITTVTNAALPVTLISVNLSSAATGTSYSYTLTVRNANGCISNNVTGSVTVNPIPTLAAGAVTNPTTCGGANGSIAFTSTNLPNGTYALSFTPTGVGATTSPQNVTVSGNTFSLTGLKAGTYSAFSVTNSNNCTGSVATSKILSDPTPTLVAGAVTNPTTCGGANGSIAFTSTNLPDGTYSLSFTPTGVGATASPKNVTVSGNAFSLTGLKSGTYSAFSVTNAGCTGSVATSKVLTDPSAPTLTAGIATNPTTCGGTGNIAFTSTNLPDGTYSLSFTPTGVGATTSPQNITVSGNAFSLSGLKAGTYSAFSVTNVGCTGSVATSKVLTDPSAPTLIAGVATNPTTCGVANGSIAFTSTNLPNGTYSLSFTPTGVGATTSPQSITVSGNAFSLSGLKAGTYSAFSVTNNNCTGSVATSKLLTDPAAPTLTAGTVTNPTTCGGANGSIAFTSTNLSNGTYSLSFTPTGTGATTSPQSITVSGNAFSLSGLKAGTYSNFSVTNSNNCTGSVATPKILTDPAVPTLIAGTSTNPTTCGGTNGNIAFTSTNLPNGTYSLSFTAGIGATTSPKNITVSGNAFSLSGLKAGTYSDFSVTNNTNCTGSVATSKILTDPATPTITAGTVLNPTTCGGTGSIPFTSANLPNGTYSLSFTATGTGATTSPRNVTVSGNAFSLTGLTAGDYSNFSLTSASCTGSDATLKTVTNPTVPTLTAGTAISPTTCGGTDGSIPFTTTNLPDGTYTLVYTGTGSPKSVIVSGGVFTLGNLSAGSYSNFSITNNGCVGTANTPRTLNDPTPPVLTLGATVNPTACNLSDGSIAFTTTNIAGGIYTLSYSGVGSPKSVTVSENSFTLSGLGDGTYSNFSITNGEGCTGSLATPVTLVDLALPVLTVGASSDPTTCSGTNGTIAFISANLPDGSYSLSFTTTGTVSPQNINVLNNAFVLSGLSAGDYSNFSVTNLGCTGSVATLKTLSNPAFPGILVGESIINPTTCAGIDGEIPFTSANLPNGVYSLTFNTTGTASPKNVTVTNNTFKLDGLSAGNYSNFTIINNGCSANSESSRTLESPPTPTITAGTVTSPSACSAADGSIAFTSTDLPDGSYTITYTGAGSPKIVTITSNSFTLTGLDDGTYSNFSTTHLGCTALDATTKTVTNPAAPILIAGATTNPTTCASTDGTIAFTTSLADGTYTINYTGSASPQSITVVSGAFVLGNLPDGTFSGFSITFAGCVSNAATSKILTDPANPTLTAGVVTNPTTCTSSDGSIAFTTSLPNGTYTLNYTGSGSPQSITVANGAFILGNLPDGIFSGFSVTAGGCTGTSSATKTLTDPAAPTLTAGAVTNPTTCLSLDGSIAFTTSLPNGTYTLNYTGSGSPKSIIVTGGAFNLTGLPDGTFSGFSVTAGGCTGITNVTKTLIDPAAPTLTAGTVTNPTTCLSIDGSIAFTTSLPDGTYTLNYTGSGSPKSIIVTSGAFNLTGLPDGTFSGFSVTTGGCTGITNVTKTLIDPAAPTLTAGIATNPTTCFGTEGSIAFTTTLPNGTYIINFTGNGSPKSITVVSGTFIITGLSAGTYNGFSIVTEGCTSIDNTTKTLTDPVPPTITAGTVTNPTTCLGTNGSIAFTSTNLPNGVYSISFTSTGTIASPKSVTVTSNTFSLTGLSAGSYTNFSLTNIGCTASDATNKTLTDPAAPIATASSNSAICAGTTLNLFGGGVGTYAWSGPNSFISTAQSPSIPIVTTLATGIYIITVTNANNCTSTATTSVTVNALPTATATNSSPICSGTTLSLTGGGGGTYLWSGSNSYTSTAQSPNILSASTSMSGIYTLMVTNINGCTSTATTSVTVNPVVVTPTPQANTQIIFGGSVTLTATGCSGVNDVLKWYQSANNLLVTMPVSPTATANYYAKCETTLNGITCISGNSADVTVTVLQPQPPLAIGAIICTGGGVTLSATGCSGSTGTFVLKWYLNATDALITMPVSPSTNTDYYAKCEQTFNSVTAISTKSNVVTVTVLNPLAPVATGGTMYSGNSITLTATGCTEVGFTLKWYQTTDNVLVTMPISPAVTTQYYAKCEQIVNEVTCISVKSNDVTVTVVNRIFVDIAKIAAPIQNGNSWATAYGNLQTGLAAAAAVVVSAPAEVWVAQGTYKPTTTTTRTIYFNMPSNVKVYGGFAGIETALNDRNFRTNTTVLSGDIGAVNIASDNSYHVVIFDGSSNTTILDGFTITGGYSNFDPKRVVNAPVLAAPLSSTIETGGGVVVQNAGSPIITNCTIVNNAAVIGGGIYANNASIPKIIACKIMSNQATFGAGIYFQDGSNGSVNNTLISGNRGIGAVYNNTSNPTITNCTMAGNGGYNGGIFNSASQPIVRNTIIWNNSTPFNDTQSIITYSTIQGGYAGTGNLSIDPQFVNLVPDGLSPNANGDYHLLASSLAIDRGDNTGISLTDTDLDGNLRRYNGGTADMGAYEFQGNPTSNIVISAQTGDWEINSTWIGFKVPALGDIVIIDANHIVTINATGIAKSIEYRGTGQIKFKTTAAKLNIGF